jgi:hypothetical protein
MADGMQNDWRELCLAVTAERDSTKLSSLVQELIEALDKGNARWLGACLMPHVKSFFCCLGSPYLGCSFDQ